MATLEEIQAQFPYLAYLINDAEVGPLLQRALDPNQPYSSDRFQAELMNTNWWKARSEQTRQLESQRNVDPGTYWNTVNAYGDELGMLAGNLGLSLSPDERYMLSVWGNNAGVAPDSASMMNQLRGLMLRNPHTALGGGGAYFFLPGRRALRDWRHEQCSTTAVRTTAASRMQPAASARPPEEGPTCPPPPRAPVSAGPPRTSG